jgi:hypothetical protein
VAIEATEDRLLAHQDDPEAAELSRLFDLYRLANLNLRYYGCRGEKYEHLAWWLDIIATLASAVALFVLLISEVSYIRFIGAGFAGLAAVCMAVAPVTGWSAKAKRFSSLHALYSHLFGQVESVITWIRREGLSREALGAAKHVHEAYRQMHALDEMEPDQELIDREDKKVREGFPENYIWNHF